MYFVSLISSFFCFSIALSFATFTLFLPVLAQPVENCRPRQLLVKMLLPGCNLEVEVLGAAVVAAVRTLAGNHIVQMKAVALRKVVADQVSSAAVHRLPLAVAHNLALVADQASLVVVHNLAVVADQTLLAVVHNLTLVVVRKVPWEAC